MSKRNLGPSNKGDVVPVKCERRTRSHDLENIDLAGPDCLDPRGGAANRRPRRELSSQKCEKNPDHQGFIAFEEFRIDHLPNKYQTADLFELVKSLGEQTGHLRVAYNSYNRPDNWPGGDKKGTRTPRYGTGFVCKPNTNVDTGEGTCPCKECAAVSAEERRKKWWRFGVLTAKHVIYDDGEAANSEFTLIVQGKDGPEFRIIAYGEKIWKVSNNAEDKCHVNFITHDEDLILKLEKKKEEYYQLERKVKKIFNSDDADLAVVVQFPHGMDSRYVTVGRRTRKQFVGRGHVWDRTKYEYNAPTCRGTSGAPVLLLPICSRTPHPHSGCGDSDSQSGGVCVIKTSHSATNWEPNQFIQW